MGNVMFAIACYIFMRAFEVLFADQRDRPWYQKTIRVIACVVLYTGIASVVWFYFNGLHLLGFDPNK